MNYLTLIKIIPFPKKSRAFSSIIAKNKIFPGVDDRSMQKCKPRAIPGFKAKGGSLGCNISFSRLFFVFMCFTYSLKMITDKLALFPCLFFSSVIACFASGHKKVSLNPALYYYFLILCLTYRSLFNLFSEKMLLSCNIRKDLCLKTSINKRSKKSERKLLSPGRTGFFMYTYKPVFTIF